MSGADKARSKHTTAVGAVIESLIQRAGVAETELGGREGGLDATAMQTAPASHLSQAAGDKVAELLRVSMLIQLGRLLLNNEVEQVPEAQLRFRPWPCMALHRDDGGACQLLPDATAADQRRKSRKPPPKRLIWCSSNHHCELMPSCTPLVHPFLLSVAGKAAQEAVHVVMAGFAA